MKKIFLILIIFGVFLSPYVIKRILKSSNIFKSTYIHNQIKNKTFDYIIIGSSRGLTTLNTNLIDSLTGLNGFNASTDGAGLGTNILMFHHLIQNNINFGNIILVLDPIGIDDERAQFSKNTYRFFPFCSEKYFNQEIKKFENTKERSNFLASYYYPGFTLCENNTVLFPSSLKALINPRLRNRFDEKGNYSYPMSKKASKLIAFDTVRFNTYGKLFEDFQKTCRKHNIQLTTYIAPIEGTYLKLPRTPNLINHSDLLVDCKYFADELHVNPLGRELATKRFVEDWIKKSP